jgi:hypothetical protein
VKVAGRPPPWCGLRLPQLRVSRVASKSAEAMRRSRVPHGQPVNRRHGRERRRPFALVSHQPAGAAIAWLRVGAEPGRNGGERIPVHDLRPVSADVVVDRLRLGSSSMPAGGSFVRADRVPRTGGHDPQRRCLAPRNPCGVFWIGLTLNALFFLGLVVVRVGVLTGEIGIGLN